MIGPAKAAARAEVARLLAHFAGFGAERVETALLQPAATLLDLYGEDIRARAYVTQDPLRGEMMLRPDFTVPLVQMHMAEGGDPARYSYAGEVFRRQETDPARPSEYLQVGYELFGGPSGAESDAEVFAAIAGALAHLRLRAAVGDVGLLIAAVGGLNTTPARKAMLMRHLWRPARFRALIERFGAPPRAPAPPRVSHAPDIGLRSRAAVEARLLAMAEDAAAPPLPATDIAVIERLLAIRAPLPQAIGALADMDLPAIGPALDRLRARATALEQHGVRPETLFFEGSFGRTTLEYYDGFVFGLYVDGRDDLPPVASGGRYDALTAVLGGGAAMPAVGGVIRPELVVTLLGAA